MPRKLVPLVLVLLALLAFWLWRENGPSAVPLAAPAPEAAHAQPLESAQPESDPAEKREDLSATAPTKLSCNASLVILCRAKETGAPLAMETLYLCEESSRPARVPAGTGTSGKLGNSLTTGPEGRVEFEVPANVQIHLWVSDWRNGSRPAQDGYLAALTPGERRELVIELDAPPQPFCGRVIAHEDRAPIAGALVTNGKVEYSTDADGRFEVPGTNELYSITCEGFAEVRVAAQGGHESPEKALQIELGRGGTLIGVLANPSASVSHDPLRLQVSTDVSRLRYADPDASGPRVGSRGMRDWRADFDATCRAVITGLPPRTPLNVAVLEGRAKVLVLPDDITLAAGEQRELRLDPSGACVLTGCARDDSDQPVAGLRLWLLHAKSSPLEPFQPPQERECSAITKTGDDGRFRIQGVAPGSWRLGPAWERRANGVALSPDAVAPVPMRIEIPEGTPALEIVLRVHRGISIRGRVLDTEDKPVNAGVTAMAGSTFLFGQADASGSFELGPLAPGRYSLHAGLTGTYEESETVEVEAGAQDVVLRVGRGATVSGQVVDGTSGEGVAAKLTLCRSGEAPKGFLGTNSRADGSFEIGGLKPGSYSLAASTEDARIGLLRAVNVGARSRVEGLRIPLAPGARLSVHYDGRQEAGSLQVLQAGALVAFDGVERGKPARFRVPSGPVRLVFTVGERELVRELTLEAGAEQELVFKDQD